MPCDYSDYPLNWPEIRKRIGERSGNRCERCGVPNRSLRVGGHGGLIKVVLTVAHLDHCLRHNDGMEYGGPALPLAEANLVHLCQACHLRHDAHDNAEKRRRRADAAAGQGRLF